MCFISIVIHQRSRAVSLSLFAGARWLVTGVAALLSFLVPGSPVVAETGRVLDLRLEEAIALALTDNRSVRDGRLAVSGNELGVQAAREAFAVKVKPLSSINYSRSDDRDVSVWEVGGAVVKTFETGVRLSLEPSVAARDGDYDAWVGVAVTVPLLRGFGREVVLDEVHTNEFAAAAARRQWQRQRIDAVVDTVAAVYGVIREDQLITLYRQQLDELGKHLRLTRSKERIGLSRSMDVYRVELRIKEIEDSLSLARERSDNLADQLKSVLSLPLEQQVRVTAPLHYALLCVDPEEATSVALKRRIEMQQGQADLVEAQRRARVAYREIMPDLQLEAAYSRGGRVNDTERWPAFDEDVMIIGLSSATDLSRSAEKARWEQSRIAVGRRQLSAASVEESIVREVRRVINGLEKSAERISLRREQITRATGKHQLAQIKFRHGEADNFDLIEAQGQLQQAKADLVTEEIQYIINGYRLRAALGTLIDTEVL